MYNSPARTTLWYITTLLARPYWQYPLKVGLANIVVATYARCFGGEREHFTRFEATINNGSARSDREVGTIERMMPKSASCPSQVVEIEMKIKRAVTFTGTLYETTTLVEAFYSSGMAESILSGVTIGIARLFATQTHGKRSRSRTNAECRELSM